VVIARPTPGSIVWQLAGERVELLSWPCAILMQLAHPLVAAGVGAHSKFRRSPVAPYERLHATVAAMRALAFGTDEDAEAARARILQVHNRVHGTLGARVGAHAAGTPYTAHDPALLLWVHATLVDSGVRVMHDVVRPLTWAERDAYCDQAASFAAALGACPQDLPRDWPALQQYIDREIAGGRVSVGEEARVLGRAVLRPALGWLAWPLQRAVQIVTIGWLPDAIRTQYGFAWDAARERRMRRVVATLRRARQWAPDALARWPEARAGQSQQMPPARRSRGDPGSTV
jgi:uncharacterized protein (DUF2236 family)